MGNPQGLETRVLPQSCLHSSAIDLAPASRHRELPRCEFRGAGDQLRRAMISQHIPPPRRRLPAVGKRHWLLVIGYWRQEDRTPEPVKIMRDRMVRQQARRTKHGPHIFRIWCFVFWIYAVPASRLALVARHRFHASFRPGSRRGWRRHEFFADRHAACIAEQLQVLCRQTIAVEMLLDVAASVFS